MHKWNSNVPQLESDNLTEGSQTNVKEQLGVKTSKKIYSSSLLIRWRKLWL